MDLELEGQSIVVTGGSSGIRFETARLLISEGAMVTICGRRPNRLDAARARLGTEQLRTVQADVLDPQQAAEVVDAALDHGSRIDGVAAIAGRGLHGSLRDLAPVDVGAEVSNKLVSLLNIVKPALPHLVEVAGRIVGLTAPTAARPDPAMAAVSAGRAAVDNAIVSLANELAASNVRVNGVGVGLIDTLRQRDRHSRLAGDVAYEDWIDAEAAGRSIPLGRAGTATEVAAAVCWMLSPVSSYTTGAVLDVTGGLPSR